VLGFSENSAMQYPTAPSPSRVSLATQVIQPLVNALMKTGSPVRLKIPSIKVDAVIRSVGLTPNGSMGIPKVPSETAWYMFGPKPGEQGSAVIAGHVNWYSGAKGVFERINALKPGDIITVQNDKGVITSFAVKTIRAIGEKENASSVFRSYDGKSHLNLVTCSGIWNRITKSYSKRLVVFADKIEKP
jgi:LPXTG-site transpeptidase (sortase) family protein